MSTFWKNLHRLSQDQLFAHGYLSPSTVREIATRRECAEPTKPQAAPTAALHWPRLASPH